MRQLRTFESKEITTGIGLYTCLLVTMYTLLPGVSGSFLFDDFANLAPLGDAQGLIDTRHELFQFATSNVSGMTGRPISVLSFLINQYAWPQSATPFLWTNLMLHLLNGIMVFIFARLTVTALNRTDNSHPPFFTPLACAAIWLIAPLHISTVFYAVQRMAELSAFFTLASLSAYISGRLRVSCGHTATGLTLLFSVPVTAFLGFYAKENAASVPLLILALELTVFSKRAETQEKKPSEKLLIAAFAIIPSGLIFAYLGAKIIKDDGTARLLAEGPVLLDYIYKLLIPQSSTRAIFYDSFSSIQSTTNTEALLSWAFIALILGTAIYIRNKHPGIALGILFFFLGHTIEASGPNLDLYYEHRNYLPSVGIALTLAIAATLLFRSKFKTAVFASAIWLAICGAQAHMRASLWGHPTLASKVWIMEAPNSPNAWLRRAFIANRNGNALALNIAVARWHQLLPHSLHPLLLSLRLECPQEQISQKRIRALIELAKKTSSFNGIDRFFNPLVTQTMSGACKGLKLENIYTLARALIENKNITWRQKAYLWTLSGRILLSRGLADDAYSAFVKANTIAKDKVTLQRQIHALVAHNRADLARKLSNHKYSDDRKTAYGPFHIRTILGYLTDPGQQEKTGEGSNRINEQASPSSAKVPQ
ncbi:hypothetical protein KBTX_03296 [wastewater metagenome]|uniref:Uncharacterized protein n=2 Tax=unclassified sequences TaxID=12908 RepID=A0A5B8RFZ8_9ZZZZ|nr:hypothetical protein [Arhodomonas sp. KWT]QEA06953.1 hypothetical protein KBTEX_03296 [uncultured organism]